MSGFLVDTNVISELSRSRPDARVLAWVAAHPELYLSVLTLGELRRGVHRLRLRGEPARTAALEQWVTALELDYSDRILAVDHEVAAAWAVLPATRTLPVVDALIAATAVARGLTVATRNVDDFADTGVGIVDPFAG